MNKIKEFMSSIVDWIKNMSKRAKIISLISVILAAATVTAAIVLPIALKKKDTSQGDFTCAGTYYYEADNTYCELILGEDGGFTLKYNTESEIGTYSKAGTVITLDFYKDSKENIVASYENGTVILTYNGLTMRMISKISFTVSFEVNGGSTVSSVSVINGKTVSKPVDPTREDFIFVGWYKDSDFKTPFTFSSDVVTSDITIYARWVEKQEKSREYTVTFDLGYDAVAPASRTTVGARLFDVLPVERVGYTFGGWWVSTDNDSARLSYKYDDTVVFTADTTLFAVWYEVGSARVEYPSVSVSDNGISWIAVNGVRTYDITVSVSDGTVIFSDSTQATSVSVPFASFVAGVYNIKVVANANAGEAYNSESYYTLVHKGLDKAEGFFVSGDSILVFDGVDNAEKYLVTVECGNPLHNHTDYDNGTSTNFTFANCPMTSDGIKFTVKAVADGYLTSVSDTFVYKRELKTPQNLVYDENESVVRWDAVADAEYYMVLIECGNFAHGHTLTNIGADTFVSVKECSAGADGITVKVYPIAEGYIPAPAAEIKFNKTNIGTPENITVNGNILTWQAVGEASGYEVSVNGEVHSASENQLDLSGICSTVGAEYVISVRAIGATASAWSMELKLTTDRVGGVTYSKNTVSWNAVLGADCYEVQLGASDKVTVYSATSLKVVLESAGENTVKVRAVKGGVSSEWTVITVTAYTVSFDTRGGNTLGAIFVANGDEMMLPVPTRTGYTFSGWYNVPGGPSSNGKEITDNVFKMGADTVFYAHYNPNKYEITYNYGTDGTGLGLVGTVEYERDYILELPTANEITTAFGGWYSEPYGNGVQYTDASGHSLAPWSHLGGMELYAFWIDQTVTFNLVKVNGREVYSVTAGPRIALVSDLTVPAYHNGLPVAMLDGGAFANCKNLKAIRLPATLEVISSLDPFSGSTSLTEIEIYGVDGVSSPRYTSVDGVLFENKANGTTALLRMPMGRVGTYTVPDIEEISASAFLGSSLTSITVPATVVKVGNDAFADSKQLTSVTFAPTLYGEAGKDLTIGKRAFSGCSVLEGIILPARLTDIELSKYSINSSGIPTLGVDHAFYGCSSLSGIVVEAGSKTYKIVDGMIYSADGRSLLYCPTAKSGALSIPVGTQSVSAGAFAGCSAITEVFVPNTVTYIGEYAFFGLKISAVSFEGRGINEVTVGDNAFYGCADLTSVTFGAGNRIAVIGSRAFYSCTSLSAFEIPSTVKEIRERAFENCSELSSVTFGANGRALEFGEAVFLNCTSLTSITIPANVSKIPGIFSGCSSLEEVEVDSQSAYFTSVDGVIFNKNMTEIIYYPLGKAGAYEIPASVTAIAGGVFSGNAVITELKIPNTVSYIGVEAFKGTHIGRITFVGDTYAESLTIDKSAFRGAYFEGYDFSLPTHTKAIGDYAFSGIFYNNQNIILNEGLEALGDYAFYQPAGEKGGAIKIPASVVSIGEYCFSGESIDYGMNISAALFVGVTFTKENSRLTTIGDFAFFKNTKLTVVDLPDSVKTIGNYAFYECKSIISLNLSASLETIGAYAFASSSYQNQLGITSLVIPSGVREIGAHAFERCQSLTTVTFEGKASSVDLILGTTYLRRYDEGGAEMLSVERGNVFTNCNKLLTVTLSPNIVTLGDYCFLSAGDSGFTVILPDDSRLATVGAYCFYKSRITAFTVPATVRNLDPTEEYGVVYNRLGIGEYAFASARDLTSITFKKNTDSYPLTIGYGAFSNTAIESVELPARLSVYNAGSEIIAPLADGALVFYGASALASVTVENGSTAYTVSGGILYTADMTELVFCPVLKDGAVTVPAAVTKIHSYAFAGCNAIGSITFEGGTSPMSIGDYAFWGCSVSEVVLPSNTVSIGERAFNNCKSLQSFSISKNLSVFDISVLDGCTALENIFVESGNTKYASEGGVLYSADKTSLILYPLGRTATEYSVPSGVLSIEKFAFRGNTSLTLVVLPSGLVEIFDGAFADCSALSAVVIPNTVQLIGEEAFANAAALTSVIFARGGAEKLVISYGAFRNLGALSVELPKRLAIIGDEAFAGANLTAISFESMTDSLITEIGAGAFKGTALVSVSFPSGIVTVGDGAFLGTLSLEDVVFGEGLEAIGTEAFKNSSIEVIYLPSTLKSIGLDIFSGCAYLTTVNFASGTRLNAIPAGAFAGCTSLESINIPATVSEIGGASKNGAFYGCASLVSVNFASTTDCEIIGDYAFYGCSALGGIELPVSVASLGSYAFYGCSSLTEITVPLATTKLGESLFEKCTALSELTLNTGAAVIPKNTFKGCTSLTYVCIPASVSEIGKDAFADTAIEHFDVAQGNISFVSISGIVYNAARTEIVCFPPNSSATTLIIPNGISSIPASNFEGCTNLKEVIFEEGGTVPLTIGEKAFLGCTQLRSVHLPERLVSIGRYAFKECTALTSINIPKNLTSIGDYAFTWCYKLYEVYNESSITEIEKKGSIKTAQPNVNVYTPTSGASILSREGDFLFANVKGTRTLIGYEGNSAEITLPSGEYAVEQYFLYGDKTVRKVVISNAASISISGGSTFTGCDNLEAICINTASSPSGWSSSWNSGKTVIYGYTGNDVTYSFVTNGASPIDPVTSKDIITLPVPVLDGYIFDGWYDNAEFNGSPVSENYYSSVSITLYAKMITEAQYIEQYLRGQSMEYAYDIVSGTTYSVRIEKVKDKNYYKVTVSAGEKWYINTPSGMGNHKLWIYDENGREILMHNPTGSNVNYTHTFDRAGTYYIGIGYYNSQKTGNFTVTFTKQ